MAAESGGLAARFLLPFGPKSIVMKKKHCLAMIEAVSIDVNNYRVEYRPRVLILTPAPGS